MMRVTGWIMPAVAMFALGCGSGTSDFSSEHAAQIAVLPDEAAVIALPAPSTAQASFPAGTFSEQVVVLLGDQLLRTDASWQYFPTVDPNSITADNETQMKTAHEGDIYSALVVNTPADELFSHDITVRFDPYENAAMQPGEQYVVYRFDFEGDRFNSVLRPRWNRWGNDTVATVAASGAYAEAALPTDGFRGYIGAIALFKGHTATALAASEQTTRIYGKVVNSSGVGIHTDIGLYLTVGGREYPAGLDAPNGRAPIGLPHPFISGQEITELNTVESDNDGMFEMIIPDRLIGQFVHLEFGHEFAAHLTQEYLNLLDPAANPDNPAATVLVDETMNLVVWYGENKVISLPVTSAN
jgi:hypothetical protein